MEEAQGQEEPGPRYLQKITILIKKIVIRTLRYNE
jgi:hypothetical protein